MLNSSMSTPGEPHEPEAKSTDLALALIEEWLSQAPTEAGEIRAAEEDLREFQKALNETRKEAGARILYPSIDS